MSQKIVYLDLNHLIYLAKQEKAGDKSLLDRIRKLVDSGKAVFPITAAHIMEISAIGKESQRADLGDIVDAVCRGYVLRSFQDMMYLEVLQATAEFYGKTGVGNLQETVLSRGYPYAFGFVDVDFTPWRSIDSEKSAELEKEFWSKALGKDALDALLAQHHPKAGEGSEIHRKFVEGTENDRKAQLGKTMQEKEEKCVVGFIETIVENVKKATESFGMKWSEVEANPPRQFWTYEFLAGFPTINVWSKMLVYLYHDPNRPIKVNHVFDVAHLSVAIPYCDVVVCDKEMVSVVTRHKLDQKYSTTMFAKLDEAIDYLESLDNPKVEPENDGSLGAT